MQNRKNSEICPKRCVGLETCVQRYSFPKIISVITSTQ